MPSTSGVFSVKSTCKLILQEGTPNIGRTSTFSWETILNPIFHGRHQTLLWWIIHKALPTKDRLSQVLPILDTGCLFCSCTQESVDHIFRECPINKLMWLRSPWQLDISDLSRGSLEEWLATIFGNNTKLPVDE